MWNEEPPQEFKDNMMKFFELSVSKIHQTQNFEAYSQWVKENYSDFLPPNDDALQVALQMARSIWNATPLSSNRYRPSPLPEVKRNDFCSCGSGKKYKQCCLHLSNLVPTIEAQDVWFMLIEEMSLQEIQEALSQQVFPVALVLEVADQYIQNDKPIDAIQILEPIFTSSTDKMGEDECAALTLLCNTYDDVSLPETQTQKLKLLHELKNNGSRLIRSEAWQRLAVITIDKGDKDAAWEAFRKAQRLTPNNPSIDLLELNLLLGDSQKDLAQQRAKIIIKKTQRNGIDSPYYDFLLAVATDPQKVIDELFDVGNTLQLDRLQAWLEQHQGRRLPSYKLDTFTADYSWMELGEEIKPFKTDLFAEPEDKEENYIFNNFPEKEHRLITPKSIEKLDMKWAKLIYYREEAFPWDEEDWIEFLEEKPQCFGSIEIIDDILTALDYWQQDEHILINIKLPLAQRAWKIYEALPEQGGLPWGFRENRSLYTSLYSIVLPLKYLGQNDKVIDYLERLIIINPNDNLGLRSELANSYLDQKEYNRLFELLRLYPDDQSLGITMAKTLGLWAIGDKENAKIQWQQIKDYNPYIKNFMLKSKKLAPELDSYGITMGGEDEAWFYRQAARDTWLAHKGAINWLKQ